MSAPNLIALGHLKPGDHGIIEAVGKMATDPGSVEMVHRLLEMGFLEGSPLEVVHQAPLSHDPLVVRVRGALIALRRSEANWVEVRLSHD